MKFYQTRTIDPGRTWPLFYVVLIGKKIKEFKGLTQHFWKQIIEVLLFPNLIFSHEICAIQFCDILM